MARALRTLSLVFTVLAGAQPAAAQGATQLCGRISSSSQQAECAQVTSGQRVDANAVAICGRISSNSDIVGCARAVAGREVPAEAVSLCGRISSNSDIVGCAQAVAGHYLDAGAVGACNRISSNSDIVACAQAIRDRRYGQDDVTLCNRQSSNSGIVQCLAGTGQPLAQPQAQAPADVRGGALTFMVVNDTPNVEVARVYVRASGASRWPASVFRGRMSPGQQIAIDLSAARWDVCVESAEGFSTWWRDLDAGQIGDRRLIVQGTVDDAQRWGRVECTTR
ncbi:MAG: hypothetical protein AB7S26_21780 [Sandaracinaceae bacterium]